MADGDLWQRHGRSSIVCGIAETGGDRQGERVANADLLKELRIEKHQREVHGGGPGRWPWIAGGAVAVLALAGLAGWWMLGSRAIEVQTAQKTILVCCEDCAAKARAQSKPATKAR